MIYKVYKVRPMDAQFEQHLCKIQLQKLEMLGSCWKA